MITAGYLPSINRVYGSGWYPGSPGSRPHKTVHKHLTRVVEVHALTRRQIRLTESE